MNEYDMAKWLAENHEYLTKTMHPSYGETQKIEWLIKYFLKEHPNVHYDIVISLFEQDKIKLILDRYYLKLLH